MIYDLQKASMGKRISAFLFDGILLGTLAVAFAFLISVITGFDNYNSQLNAAYEKYEAQYGMTFDITYEEYNALTPEQSAVYEEAYNALSADEEAMSAYSMIVSLTLVITTFGILLAYAVLEFLIPLLFGNGQTLGKKIFSVGLMRTDGVKLTTFQLFVRTFLGKYTIETMIPMLILLMLYFGTIGIVGTAIILGLLLLDVILIIATKTNSTIHDLLAVTVAVDISSQMIFRSPQDLIDYQKKVAAEKAARQVY